MRVGQKRSPDWDPSRDQVNKAKKYHHEAKDTRISVEKAVKELKKLETERAKLKPDSPKIKRLDESIISKTQEINLLLGKAQGFQKKEWADRHWSPTREADIRSGIKQAVETGKVPLKGIQKQLNSLRSFFAFFTGKPFSEKDLPKLEKLAVELKKLHETHGDKLNSTAYHKTSLEIGKALLMVNNAHKLLPEHLDLCMSTMNENMDKSAITREAYACMLRYILYNHPEQFSAVMKSHNFQSLDQLMLDEKIISKGFLEKAPPHKRHEELPVVAQERMPQEIDVERVSEEFFNRSEPMEAGEDDQIIRNT